ncbi:MAG TPA: GNAT family N-acetyltransferase [Steroidobacteraceae bacterium]|nr:GNAT family N-acetyltransferase [Steroidobacteraceae bacterium]
MTLIECAAADHAAAIREIFNEEIAHSTAIYEYQPRSEGAIRDWFAEKRAGGWPILGALDADGRLAGFATFGTFRARPAYKYAVEHSVYVHKDRRGAGVGSALLRALIEEARRRDLHTMIGGIDAANGPSIALHERFGFRHVGTIAEAGYKFGRWLDLVFYELILDTPRAPVEP